MKKQHFYYLLFVAILLLTRNQLGAQSVVSTTGSFLNNNGSGTVVFNFQNTNPYPILITKIEGLTGTTGTVAVQFLYKTTPNSGPPGAIDSANGWTLVASGSITGIGNTATTVTQDFFTNLTFLVPANTTYAFAVFAAGQRYFSIPAATNPVDSADGCRILSGNLVSYAGGTPPAAPGNHPRGWIGKIHFTPALSCTGTPTAGNAFSSVSLACPSQSFQLGLQNDSSRLGLNYQWLSSSSGLPGTYSVMSGDTTRFISKSQTATTWYRCMVTCGSSTGVDTSTAIQVTTPVGSMNGSYTINPSLPISSTNYHTFTDFATNISCVGVTGPVTVTLAPGLPTLNGQISFGNISGASATNTITIIGNGNTITSASSPIVSFSGTQYLTWDSLNVAGTGAFAGFAMHFGNQSRYITIENSTIDAGNTSTGTGNAAIVASGSTTAATTVGNNAQYLTIRNNKIIGGYYGITLIGNTGFANNFGHILENNEVTSFYIYGIYVLHGDSILIKNNDINRLNRSAITTFYGLYNSNSRYIRMNNNKIHDAGNGSYGCYPVYIASNNASSGYETELVNNLIYNNQTSSTYYAIYGLTSISGLKIYHNTLFLNGSPTGAGAKRAIFISTAPNNVDVKNNIIDMVDGTGIKYGIYITTTSASFTSNRNVIYNNTTGTNYFGYWTANRTTLGDWQTATSQDANSSVANPAFVNPTGFNFTPLSNNIDNIGAPVGVLTDFTGALRSTTTPDVGAIEFTGVSGDLSISDAQIIRSSLCYGSVDTVRVKINNVIGSTMDFSVNPLTVVYRINGPVSFADSTLLVTGTIPSNGNIVLTFTNTAFTAPGIYTISASISPNAGNVIASNDTISNQASTEVQAIVSVTPRTALATAPTDTFVLQANSPLFPAGKFLITEVAHFKTGTGAPVGGWPAYLVADDYIEITGVPNSDLAGVILEQWSTTALLSTYTFPTGTKLGPNGTAVIAVGQLGGSTPSPANFYYHANYTGTFGSTTTAGRILRNSTTNAIIDAVAYGTYTFPAAAGVTAADWSGATPSVSSSGNRLVGPDVNSGTNWINSGTSPQDPNVLNSGVPLPTPASAPGFEWTFLGSYLDTNVNITVGPYTTPGIYAYVANYTTVCGTFRDTVFVTASSTVPVEWSYVKGSISNEDAIISWGTASETNSSHFEIENLNGNDEFKTISKIKAAGKSSVLMNYKFKHENAFGSGQMEQIYRIKQVDKDGKYSYSKLIILNLNELDNTSISLYPNPSNGAFVISGIENNNATVKIFDLMGKEVSNQLIQIKSDLNAGIIEVNNSLSKGVYFVQINSKQASKTIKFIKE